jgi:hypothetical protein
MSRTRPLPNVLQSPAFDTKHALALGVSPSRLRASDLDAPFTGIRATSRAETVAERCLHYLPRLRSGQFFSHSTAAVLLRVPLPRRIEADARLHVSDRGKRPRTRGIVGHRSASTPIAHVGEIPVTHPDWLLAELASELTVEELVVAGDALVRRKRSATTLDALRTTAARLDARGILRVRAALEHVRSGTDSPMETRLRLLITRAGLPEPVIGHTIRDVNGDFIGTPDLAYVEQRIAIEYEGAVHRDDPRVFAEDILRRELMQEADWYVIRVISDHVFRSPAWLAARISRILAQRTIV